jgi:hypothetical protein
VAYTTEQEIRNTVLNRGRGVSGALINGYIAEAIEVITLGDEEAQETALSRRAVREYVIAEVLRQMKLNGDMISLSDIQAADTRSQELTDAYRASTTSTEDDAYDRPRAFIGPTPW